MGNMTRSPEQAAEYAARCARVLELRKGGYSFPQIARALGYANHTGAKKAYDAAMRPRVEHSADELRALDSERLDALQAAVWAKAAKGDAASIDRALAIMDRRMRLPGTRGGPVYSKHLLELQSLDCADSADGQVVLALADALDDWAGAPNMAATAKALTELMKAVRDSRPAVTGSVSDDLVARRAKRRATAS